MTKEYKMIFVREQYITCNGGPDWGCIVEDEDGRCYRDDFFTYQYKVGDMIEAEVIYHKFCDYPSLMSIRRAR